MRNVLQFTKQEGTEIPTVLRVVMKGCDDSRRGPCPDFNDVRYRATADIKLILPGVMGQQETHAPQQRRLLDHLVGTGEQ